MESTLPLTADYLSTLAPETLHSRALGVRSRLACSEWELGLHLLAAERMGLPRLKGCGTVTHYAEQHLKLDTQKASELLRTARALEKLPRLDEAYRSAKLCWGKIRELTRIVCPDTEEVWLDFALNNSTNAVQRQVRMSPREFKRRAQSAGKAQLTLTESLPEEAACEPNVCGATASRPPEWACPQSGSDGPQSGAGEPQSSAGGPQSSPGGLQSGAGEPQSSPGGPQSSAGGPPPSSPRRCGPHPNASGPSPDPRPGGSHSGQPADKWPLPLPGPKIISVTLHFTAPEFAAWEEVVNLMRGRLRKRARREEAVLAMAAAAKASSSKRAQARHQVIVHVSAETGQGWYDTDRGLLEAPPEKVDEALDDGQLLLCGPDDGSPPSRKESEHFYCSKPGSIPMTTLAALYVRAGGRCESCQCKGPLHVHHRQPRSRGGTNDLSNLELRCGACHTMTHDKDYRQDPTWRRARDARIRRRRKRQASD